MSTPVRIFVSAGLGLGLLAFASAASAMPVAKLDGASAAVEEVRYGCGPGWRPNRWGECVPVRRRYYAPPPRFFDPWGPPRWRHHYHHHRNYW